MFPVPGDALEGIYYAHGRWYVADTGLWLSPNEKGDYLYGGDGQDPMNKGWYSVGGSAQVAIADEPHYIRTDKYGFIDKNHFQSGVEHAEKVLNYLNDPDGPLFSFTEGATYFGMTAEVEVIFRVNHPVPPQLRNQVGLAMYLELEYNWEVFEYYWLNLKESGYGIEDFPSDYLGFYSYATQTPKTVILDEVLKTQWHYTDEEPPRCQLLDQLTRGTHSCNSIHNFDYRPKLFDPTTQLYHNIEWPAPLNSFTPYYDANLWRTEIISCTFYGAGVQFPVIGTPRLPAACGTDSGANPRAFLR